MAMVLNMVLNDAETEKLEALARCRKRTPEQCIRDFIVTCQPGGSGWQHPMTTVKRTTVPPEK